MSWWKHRAFWLLPVVLPLLVMSGCGDGPDGEAVRSLNVGNGPEPQALDPLVTTSTSALNIQLALWEGLVGHDRVTLEPVPAVAERWEILDEGRRYHFYLRTTAQWSDGTPVQAGDFVAAWERVRDPELAAPYAGFMDDLERFEAVGPHLLEVVLKAPSPHFLHRLQHPVWGPLPSHLAAASTSDPRIGKWTTAEAFCGNGPYRLKAWRPGQFIEVERNPRYWDADAVTVPSIRFFIFDDPAAEERAFLAGQLQATDALPPARVPAYREQNDPRLRISDYLGTYYILPNHAVEPLGDVRVRQALSLAIDREAITERLLGAGQTPAGGFVPGNLPGYGGQLPVLYDPEAARALFAEAGFSGGEGFPELEYLFNSSESHRRIGEALQSMWAEVLGIEVRLVNQEWRTYLQRRSARDFQLARAVWIGDYPEPSTFLNLWRSDSAQNWTGWLHPSYDAHLAAADIESDPARRTAHYKAAEAQLISEQAIIPLYFYVTAYLLDPRVEGWAENLLDWPVWKAVRLKSD